MNMMPGILCPFNAIIDYQRYASALAFSEARPQGASVSPNGSHVTYKDCTLEVSRWLIGLRTLFNDTKAMIQEFCRDQTLDIKIPAIVADNMSNNTRGYSWLDNGHFIKDRCVMQILLTDTNLNLCQKGRGRLIFNTGAMHNIMAKAAEINSNLAILCHALPGQPPRGAEFVECKIRNSTRPRNFFRIHGSLWFVTRRLKVENLSRREVFIPIKVPPELQELLEIYCLGIRPVEVDFARKLYGEDVATLYHEYLYVQYGQRLEGSRFSQTLHGVSKEYFDCGMMVRTYRHIAVEIARIYLGSEYEIDEDEEDALAEQSGHSAATRRWHYAPERGLLPALSSDLILRFGVVSEWWWKLVGFYPGAAPLLPLLERRRLRGTWQPDQLAMTSSNPQQNANSVSNLDSSRLMEQITATIKGTISEMEIGLEARIQASVASAMAEFLSRQTRQPLMIQDAEHSISAVQNPAPQTDVDHFADMEDMYWNAPAQPTEAEDSALLLLQKFFPDKANVAFRTQEQHEMVKLSLSKERSFIGILPTGGGKSLVFLLPAFQEENLYTLVIIPNKALLNDMLRKARDAGIEACQWLANRTEVGDARLIFLALESATSPTFNAYVINFF